MPEKSEVKLFYPSFDGNITGQFITKFEENYWFSLDKSWIDENSSKTLYIQTPKEKNSIGCYRYILDSLDMDKMKAIKVYR